MFSFWKTLARSKIFWNCVWSAVSNVWMGRNRGDLWRQWRRHAFISVCGIIVVSFWTRISCMVLEYLNLYSDDMYVMLYNIIFRLTQMDTDNAVMKTSGILGVRNNSYWVHIPASGTGMLNVVKVTDFSSIRLQNTQSCSKVISWSLETAVCGIVPLDYITLKGVSNILSTSVSRPIYLLLSWVVTVQTLSSAQSAHHSLESLSG